MNENENRHPEIVDPRSSGGQGGPLYLKDGPGQTSDTRLIERAIRERWPIKPEYRTAIINRLLRIAVSPETSDREAISASKAMIAADKINIDLETASQPKESHTHQHLHLNVPPDEARAAIGSVTERLRIAGLASPVEAGSPEESDSPA